jgi:hypothetical protein
VFRDVSPHDGERVVGATASTRFWEAMGFDGCNHQRHGAPSRVQSGACNRPTRGKDAGAEACPGGAPHDLGILRPRRGDPGACTRSDAEAVIRAGRHMGNSCAAGLAQEQRDGMVAPPVSREPAPRPFTLRRVRNIERNVRQWT